jgi:hypothetical protein
MNHERLELKPVAALSDDERAALKALSSAVYPPDVIAASPRRHLTWAPPDYGVLVRIRPGTWFHTWVSSSAPEASTAQPSRLVESGV